MLYFKRLIQIPRLPERYLRPPVAAAEAAALPVPALGLAGVGVGGRVAGGRQREGLPGCWGGERPRLQPCLSGTPNFLRALRRWPSIKPVVVIPEGGPRGTKNLRTSLRSAQGPRRGASGEPPPSSSLRSPGGARRNSPRQALLPVAGGGGPLEQTFGPPNGSVKDDR